MIYENWHLLKPLTAPVPVGTKVVIVGESSERIFPLGEIVTIYGKNYDGCWYSCINSEGLHRYRKLDELALLPQSTMTEQERWQFGCIDLDACECVEHEGKRYPCIVASDKAKYILLCVFNGIAMLNYNKTMGELESGDVVAVSFDSITVIPKKQAPTTSPWTQDEVLGLVRKGVVELCDEYGRWVSASDYQIESSGQLLICGWVYHVYTAYRSQDTNWEPQPLTKVVE